MKTERPQPDATGFTPDDALRTFRAARTAYVAGRALAVGSRGTMARTAAKSALGKAALPLAVADAAYSVGQAALSLGAMRREQAKLAALQGDVQILEHELAAHRMGLQRHLEQLQAAVDHECAKASQDLHALDRVLQVQSAAREQLSSMRARGAGTAETRALEASLDQLSDLLLRQLRVPVR